MLAAPAGSGPRISQLLPSVTCSTCGHSVSLDELADHVCKPESTPASAPEPSVSKTSLLSQRLQDLTNRRESAASQSSRSSYSTQRSPSPVRTTRAPSPASTIRSNHTYRPESQFTLHDRIPSTSSRAPSIARSASPAASIPPPRAPSAASYRSRTPSSTISANQPPPPAQRAPSAASNRPRAPSNASSRSAMPYPGTANIAPPSQRRPSVTSSFRSPGEEQRRPSYNNQTPPPPLAGIPRSLSPARAPVTPPLPPPSPGAHSIYAEDDIDTKTGGEAGMAGVGRRGFAAAARAAMFATSAGSLSPFQEQAPSMTGRRVNAPPFLDIARAGKSSF